MTMLWREIISQQSGWTHVVAHTTTTCVNVCYNFQSVWPHVKWTMINQEIEPCKASNPGKSWEREKIGIWVLGSGLWALGVCYKAWGLRVWTWDVETTTGGVRCRNLARLETIQCRQSARWKVKCRKWSIQNRLQNQDEDIITGTLSLCPHFCSASVCL